MTTKHLLPLALWALAGCAAQKDAPQAAVETADGGTTIAGDPVVVESAPCGAATHESPDGGSDTHGSSAVAAFERTPVLIRFRSQADLGFLERIGARSLKRIGHQPLVAAKVTAEERARLLSSADVLSVTPDRLVHAFGQGTASAAASSEYPPGIVAVQAPDVWDADRDGVLDEGAPTGAGIKVCVVDSGIDLRHPELKAAVAGGHDFVDDDDDPTDGRMDDGHFVPGGGHGTHVAGTIAARLGAAGALLPGMNAGGVAGVAPGAQLLVARVLDVTGNGATSDVLRALDWCSEQGAKIVSLSLGAPNPSDEERAGIAQAQARGMLIVAASGNSGDFGQPVSFPAAYPGVVAVGAVDQDGKPASFTQKGPELALVAPGVDILSCGLVGEAFNPQVEVDGTSYNGRQIEYTRAGTGFAGRLVDCGMGDSYHACGEGAACDGFVALVRRGTLTFSRKERFVRGQGARAIIYTDNDPAGGLSGTFTYPGDWIPSVLVSLADAPALQAKVGRHADVELLGADYMSLSGTSMATPHVSGAAALVWSARPSLSADEVKQLLFDSARDVGAPGRDDATGYGLVQVKAAVELQKTR